MSGHTPGPWRTDPNYYIYVWAADSKMVADLPFEPEETFIARMRGVGRGATPAEQKANAHLIAAAPDLLAALRLWDNGCYVEGGPYPDCDCYGCRTRRAIAKAEGR